MNMFGGSGRLTNLPKTRTSFPFPLPDHRFGAGDTSDTRKCHSECTSPTGRAEARTAATTAQGSDHDQHHHHHGAALHHDQHLQRRQQHFQEDDSAAISTTSPGRFNSIYGTTEGSKLFGAHTTTTEEHNLGTNVPPPAGSSGDGGGTSKQLDSVLFSQSEIMGLRLMFSLFDR